MPYAKHPDLEALQDLHLLAKDGWDAELPYGHHLEDIAMKALEWYTKMLALEQDKLINAAKEKGLKVL